MSNHDSTKHGVGEVHQVTQDKNLLRKFKHKINALSRKQKLLLIIFMLVAFAGITVVVNWSIRNEAKDDSAVQVNDQGFDEADLDEMLQKYEEDPSSIPDGRFKPELGDDYFRTKKDKTNRGSESNES